MVKKILLILMLSYIHIITIAQENISVVDQYGISNSVYIEQSGLQNKSSICQSGELNSFEVFQEGMGNFVYYKDIGTPLTNDLVSDKFNTSENSLFHPYNILNTVSVTQTGRINQFMFFNTGINCQINVFQSGINNDYNGSNVGQNNIFEISQIGNRNKIDQDIRVSNHDFILSQEGDFNRIIHTDNSAGGFDMIITQKGDWIKTIVKNGIIIN